MKSTEVAPFSKVHTGAVSPEEFLTTYELMKLLKIKHRQTIYALVAEGMPAILVGKNYRFIKQEVIDHFKQQSVARRVGGKK